MDLGLNNQQWSICHKIKPNQTKPNQLNSNSYRKLYKSLKIISIR